MADVFLSYSNRDRAAARKVFERFKREGWSVWWDRGLLAGDTWTDSIRRELTAARCVVVLWSKASWESKWVQAEAESAFSRGILVAGRLDGVSVLAPFNIIHTADVREPQGLDHLVAGIRQKHSTPQSDSTGHNLQGIDIKVRLAISPVGVVLKNADDGSLVSVRRSLSQDVLLQVPRDDAVCRFVNLTTNSGEVVSCIIYGDDNRVFGDERAFWWALARVTFVTTSARVNFRTRAMGTLPLMDVCVSAQCAWEEAIKHSPIIQMRTLSPASRDRHFRALSNMIDAAPTFEARLGYQVALSMVLAVQSEDVSLEGQAYRAFKQYLWPPGDEPTEFAIHDS